MAYGSGDYAAEDAREIQELNQRIAEAKYLLALCKRYILSEERSPFSEELLFKQISDYTNK